MARAPALQAGGHGFESRQLHWIAKIQQCAVRWEEHDVFTSRGLGIGIAIGAGGGVGLGALIGNMGIGVAAGIAVGIAVAADLGRRRRDG